MLAVIFNMLQIFARVVLLLNFVSYFNALNFCNKAKIYVFALLYSNILK